MSETLRLDNLQSASSSLPATNSNIHDKPHHDNLDTTPLLLRPKHKTDHGTEALTHQPPLAGPEIDDLDDDTTSTATAPYPGVDDGFFNHEKNPSAPDAEHLPPDVEYIPKDSEHDYIPVITSRAGGDESDETDGGSKPPVSDTNSGAGSHRPKYPEKPGIFPYAPGYGHDLEIGSMMPTDLESIPDVNVYQHKKTLAQGMMDLALFSANANQLRYVIESYSRHPYYYPSIILLSFSLLLQVAIGVGLIWNATYNVKDQKEICIANKINNFTVIGIFLVTVINVFISAFGVADQA